MEFLLWAKQSTSTTEKSIRSHGRGKSVCDVSNRLWASNDCNSVSKGRHRQQHKSMEGAHTRLTQSSHAPSANTPAPRARVTRCRPDPVATTTAVATGVTAEASATRTGDTPPLPVGRWACGAAEVGAAGVLPGALLSVLGSGEPPAAAVGASVVTASASIEDDGVHKRGQGRKQRDTVERGRLRESCAQTRWSCERVAT